MKLLNLSLLFCGSVFAQDSDGIYAGPYIGNDDFAIDAVQDQLNISYRVPRIPNKIDVSNFF